MIATEILKTVLASARDVLTRAETAERVPPRALARFAKKVRLAEKAARAAQSGGTTEAGLRAIVARTEAAAAKRAPTPEQTRALEELRARLARLDADAGAWDVSELTESLRADTDAIEAQLAKVHELEKHEPKPSDTPTKRDPAVARRRKDKPRKPLAKAKPGRAKKAR
jgi:hypothetical protein